MGRRSGPCQRIGPDGPGRRQFDQKEPLRTTSSVSLSAESALLRSSLPCAFRLRHRDSWGPRARRRSSGPGASVGPELPTGFFSSSRIMIRFVSTAFPTTGLGKSAHHVSNFEDIRSVFTCGSQAFPHGDRLRCPDRHLRPPERNRPGRSADVFLGFEDIRSFRETVGDFPQRSLGPWRTS